MRDHLLRLKTDQRALDLGCGSGSVSYDGLPCHVVGLDIAFPAPAFRLPRVDLVRGTAPQLPFASRTFHLIIANHVLEHVRDWRAVLRESARVLAPGGHLLVTVPDGYCLSDSVFRFLDKGREHVNRFHREELVAAIEKEAQLRLLSWRVLYSSYSFLHRSWGQKFGGRASPLNAVPPGMLRAGLHAWNWLARAADSRFSTTWSRYGWLFIFGSDAASAPVEEAAQPNVCVCCGSSHAASWLLSQGTVSGRRPRRYRCPSCKTTNLFFGWL